MMNVAFDIANRESSIKPRDIRNTWDDLYCIENRGSIISLIPSDRRSGVEKNPSRHVAHYHFGRIIWLQHHIKYAIDWGDQLEWNI